MKITDENYTHDFLPGTDIYLYQHKKMFRTNTDTALLGHFMCIRKKDVVLDIGTNNGALLLYANQHQPKAMIGVDIQAEACALARYNMKYHNIETCDIIEGDIFALDVKRVSCIVCNPPYFKLDDIEKTNNNKALGTARHEMGFNMDTLLCRISNLLQDKGRVYMVHRADRFIDIACSMRLHHLEIKKVQFVFDEAKEDARSVLIEAMKGGKPHCKVLSPKVIKRSFR